MHARAIQLQYNCNIRIFSCTAVVLHLCGPNNSKSNGSRNHNANVTLSDLWPFGLVNCPHFHRPSRVQAEPGRQTHFGPFLGKKHFMLYKTHKHLLIEKLVTAER